MADICRCGGGNVHRALPPTTAGRDDRRPAVEAGGAGDRAGRTKNVGELALGLAPRDRRAARLELEVQRLTPRLREPPERRRGAARRAAMHACASADNNKKATLPLKFHAARAPSATGFNEQNNNAHTATRRR